MIKFFSFFCVLFTLSFANYQPWHQTLFDQNTGKIIFKNLKNSFEESYDKNFHSFEVEHSNWPIRNLINHQHDQNLFPVYTHHDEMISNAVKNIGEMMPHQGGMVFYPVHVIPIIVEKKIPYTIYKIIHHNVSKPQSAPRPSPPPPPSPPIHIRKLQVWQ